MKLGKYQTEAAVTIATDDPRDMAIHAVLGLVAEVSEFLHALCSGDEEEHVQKEIGDVCWMIAELCTANGWKMNEVVSFHSNDVEALNLTCTDRICSIYQKTYQGHPVDEEKVKSCLKSIWGGLMGCCAQHGWKMQDILDINIKKLRKRYPDGFKVENSLQRAEGDV